MRSSQSGILDDTSNDCINIVMQVAQYHPTPTIFSREDFLLSSPQHGSIEESYSGRMGPMYSPRLFKMEIDQLKLKDIMDEVNDESTTRSPSTIVTGLQPPSCATMTEIKGKQSSNKTTTHDGERLKNPLTRPSNISRSSSRSGKSSPSLSSSAESTPMEAVAASSDQLHSTSFARPHIRHREDELHKFFKEGMISTSPARQRTSVLTVSNSHPQPILSSIHDPRKYSIFTTFQQESISQSSPKKGRESPPPLLKMANSHGIAEQLDLNEQSIASPTKRRLAIINNPPPLQINQSSLCDQTVIQGENPGSFGASKRSVRSGGLQGVWMENAFLIITLTKKFINNLKELSMKYKFSKLKQSQFHLIDDIATHYPYFQVHSFFKNDQPSAFDIAVQKVSAVVNKNLLYVGQRETSSTKLYISKCLKFEVGVLLPDSSIKIVWDCFILFILCLNVIFIPLKIAFQHAQDISSLLILLFEDIPSWALLCDVFLNFNTAYYSKGVINSKRSKIIKHYIHQKLTQDLIIVGPFLLQLMFDSPILTILLLMRSNKILNTIATMEELLNLRQYQTAVMSLVKLIFTILYIGHICGCFYYYMHVLQINVDPSTFTWVMKFQMEDVGIVSQYVASVYWAVITMITVGYGDIYPVTTIEKVYCIVVTLLSCGVFAYAVNAVGYIIQEMTKRGVEFRLTMSSLTNYMRQRDLSNTMQMRVRKYFEYLHYEQQKDNEVGQQMLNRCHIMLKQEVLTEMYFKILNSRKEFRLNFSKEFLLKLSPKMRERRFGPEEMVFKEGEHIKRVFFLMHGNIALQRTHVTVAGNSNKASETSKDINIKYLKKGDVCGLESFLQSRETTVSARTLNVVSLVYLKEDDFLSALQEFNSDKEKYAMMKDKLNLQKEYRGLGINCFLCDSFTHQYINCPYMSYQPNSKKVISKFNEDQKQERQLFSRTPTHTPKTIAIATAVQEIVIKYLLENNPYETLDQLIEKIQILETEDALQIDTPQVLAKYIQEPQDFEDIEDIHEDEEIDRHFKVQSEVNGSHYAQILQRDDLYSHSNQFEEESSMRIPINTVESIDTLDKHQQLNNYLYHGISGMPRTPDMTNSQGQQNFYKQKASFRAMLSGGTTLDRLLDSNRRGEEKKLKPSLFTEFDRINRMKADSTATVNTTVIVAPSVASDLQINQPSVNQQQTSPHTVQEATGTPQKMLNWHPGSGGDMNSKQSEYIANTPSISYHYSVNSSMHRQPGNNNNNLNYNNYNKSVRAGMKTNLREEDEFAAEKPTSQSLAQQQQYCSLVSNNTIGGGNGESPMNIQPAHLNFIQQQLQYQQQHPQQNQLCESRHEEFPQSAAKEFMTLYSFDREQQWKLYFPENNLSHVLSMHAKIVDKRLVEKRQQRKKTRLQTRKIQQMHQILSNIQTTKNTKSPWSRSKAPANSHKPRNSFRDFSMNMQQLHHSQAHIFSPNGQDRDLSKSYISSYSEMPQSRNEHHENIE